MPADDDVLNLEVGDRVGDDALAVDVGRGQDVCDVAVDEDVAGPEAKHGGFGDAGVGAADPEDLGLLAGGEGGEEVWGSDGGLLGPLLVFGNGGVEGVCDGSGGLLARSWLWKADRQRDGGVGRGETGSVCSCSAF